MATDTRMALLGVALVIVAILLVFFGALEQQFGLHFQQAAWAVILVVLAIISLRLVRNFSR